MPPVTRVPSAPSAPQLLDLSEDLDFEHNERVNRPPPAEPLVLSHGHELGDPCCVWREGGGPPMRSWRISHPGMKQRIEGITQSGVAMPNCSVAEAPHAASSLSERVAKDHAIVQGASFAAFYYTNSFYNRGHKQVFKLELGTQLVLAMLLGFNFGVVGLALALMLWLAVHQPAPARRLRRLHTGEEVAAPIVGSWSEQCRSLASHGWNAVCPPARRVPITAQYHLFLSHHWGTGQDQMRVVKQRLLEVLPGARIFLDVDEPGFEIGDLESYVARSRAVLVFCSRGYFQSKNCMRELRAAVASGKPLIALLEPEAGHGGLAEEDVRRQLLHGHCHDESVRWPWVQHAQPRSVPESYESWGFGPRPSPRELVDALLPAAPPPGGEPIEWNRLSPHQDVTLRLIAQRLLPPGSGEVRIDGEATMTSSAAPLAPPSAGRTHHLYCSRANAGAEALVVEMLAARDELARAPLRWTCSPGDAEGCEAMLVYLTARTWVGERGAPNGAFAQELRRAMERGTRLVLAHEMPGRGQEGRAAVEFGAFLSDGHTPRDLIAKGVYALVAVPLKGGAWRETSMALLEAAVREGGGGTAAQGVGGTACCERWSELVGEVLSASGGQRKPLLAPASGAGAGGGGRQRGLSVLSSKVEGGGGGDVEAASSVHEAL